MVNLARDEYCNGPLTVAHLANQLYRFRMITFNYRRSPERDRSWNVFLAYAPVEVSGISEAVVEDHFHFGLPGVSGDYCVNTPDPYELLPEEWLKENYVDEEAKVMRADADDLADLLEKVIAAFRSLIAAHGDPKLALKKIIAEEQGKPLPETAASVPDGLTIELG